MVLKKSKGSFAVTGNTIRRGGKKWMQKALKAAYISNRTGNRDGSREGQWDDFFDGQKSWNGFQPLSLNKKSRWLIPEELEERCERYKEQRSKEKLYDESNAKQQPKRKCSKKQRKAEECLVEKKTRIIEKTFLSRSNEYNALYDSIGDSHFVKRGRSWKSQRDDRDDGDYDAVYEITSGLPSKTWPFNITSQWRHDDRRCKDWCQVSTQNSYKGKACSKNRRKALAKDIVTELMDCYDYEEDMDIPDAEVPSLVDRTEVQNTYQLSVFVIKKQYKSERKKTNFCMDLLAMEAEDDRGWEIIYADKEDYQTEVIRREENNTIPAVSQVLDGFIEMKIVVETSTIAITNLAKLYPKEYFEGRSRPRKFGIVLNSFFNEREVIPGMKCFIIAEQISTDVVKNQTTLNIKLIGNEKAVAQLANYIDRSGTKAFQLLNGHNENTQDVNVHVGIETGKPDMPEFLQCLTRWNPSCFPAHEVFDLLAAELFLEIGEDNADYAEDISEDIEIVTFHCGICFEDLVNPSVDASSMQLHNCLHTFCRDCWMLYLYQMIRDQKQIIICPELGCTETVDIITLLSMLDHKLAQFYLKNKFEHFIARKTDWQWCPGCERLGHCPGYQPLESKSKICDTPVMKCGCYKTWCFECQENQHWPINCEDMRRYKAIFEEKRARIFDRFGNIHETTIFVQYCPSCHIPFEKYGGCNKMLCICQKSFCWRCGRLECLASNCYEMKFKPITFTSFDDLGEKYTSKAIKKALQFCYLRRQLGIFKKKLRVAKQSKSSDKEDPDNLLIDTISSLISDIYNVCTVVENIAATGFTSQSKHYKMRLYRFADWVEFVISTLNKTLKKDRIMNVNIKELNDTADQLKQNLIKFIKGQLSKSIK